MTVRQATFYFALVYFSQGICQIATLLNQPLRMYLQKVVHYNAQQVSQFIFITTIPWMIKPAYGLLSDFFPIFGYRRKSYLLLLNLVAALAFALVAGITTTPGLLIMLSMTGVGVAASDVVVDAMMVRAGQQTGRTRLFQSAQWFAISLAAILAGLLGAAICHRFAEQPASALRTAALIAMGVPCVVAVLTWFLVTDEPAQINLPEFIATGKALLGAFASGRLWLVVAFLFLTKFNPGIQTALYTHLEKRVGLSPAYLAILDTAYNVGQVLGSLLFMGLLSGRVSTRVSLAIGLLVGAAGLLPMLLIKGKTSATIAYGTWGTTDMIANLAMLTIAAEACPRRVEAVVFAALMSVINLSMSWSDVVGSKLYENAGPLQHRMSPLIVASAILTAAGLLLVPVLPRRDDEQQEPARPTDPALPAAAP